MQKRSFTEFLLIGFALFLMACQTVPESERDQLLLVSPEAEQALGDQAFEQMMRGKQMIDQGEDYERLQRVGQDIVAVAQPELEARGHGDLNWSFHLVDDSTLNAFVVPSGQVVFTSGILPVLEDKDGMAAVMGHEVAHVIARHGGERISQQMLISGGTLLAALALADDANEAEALMGMLGVGIMFGVQFPFSRLHEAEADDIGTRLMAKAGYDPRAAVQVWARMEEATINIPAFLSTHPPSSARQEALEANMSQYLMLREAANDATIPRKVIKK